MKAVKQSIVLAALCASLFSTSAHAWWNGDFKQRTKVTLNTSAQGVETKEALSGVVVPVRLHSGNFDFLSAKPDGSDLRVVGADDKTPLKFWVERFDGANELAVVWVQLPSIAPGTDKNTVHVYAGSEKAAAEATSPAIFDSSMLAAFSWSDKTPEAADASGQIKTTGAVAREANGQIGASLKLDGNAVQINSDKLKATAGNPYSVSLWVKPEAAAGAIFKQGPLSLSLDGGKLSARLGTAAATGGELPASAWAHVAVTVGGGKLALYLNGEQVASADLGQSPAIEGTVVLGEGVRGLVDQLEVASTVRSAEWLKLAAAAQRADAKLVAAVTQTEDGAKDEGGGEPGHFAILVNNLTTDAWVVIIILGIMFVIAAWVMYDKAVLVGRADKDNLKFLAGFRDAKDVLTVSSQDMKHSQLARLYEAGMRELKKRDVGVAGAAPLSGASIDAVKAAIDADLIRESHTLNSKIVLLTIAISGGPFLGLLGTVVGVMITFAAIAAAAGELADHQREGEGLTRVADVEAESVVAVDESLQAGLSVG